MTNVKNELPVAVHHKSGGSARTRVGGATVSLEGVSSGSFQLVGGTRYRLCFSVRAASGLLLLVGYTSPVTLANASAVLLDLARYDDDVPDGTTVYFTTISPVDLLPTEAGAGDCVYASFYG